MRRNPEIYQERMERLEAQRRKMQEVRKLICESEPVSRRVHVESGPSECEILQSISSRQDVSRLTTCQVFAYLMFAMSLHSHVKSPHIENCT